eukprot:2077697-Rhodomonas_salina.1
MGPVCAVPVCEPAAPHAGIMPPPTRRCVSVLTLHCLCSGSVARRRSCWRSTTTRTSPWRRA